MNDTIPFLVYIYACFYVIFATGLAVGILRFRTRDIQPDPPSVSVVVCARNEESDIRRCMKSLRGLEYPREKLEILIVDDESGDGTPGIIDEIASRDNVFRVLSTREEPHDLPAKQRPLNLGILSAKGEIILVTDADCAVQPGWVRSHVAAYDETVGIAGGVTKVSTESGTIFDRLQNTDLVSKLGVAMGCAGLGVPLTVMGNNISFRRRAYVDLGGFEKIAFSIVEDMALMNAIQHDAGLGVSWARGEDGVVVSSPESSFSDFVAQRRRWVHEIEDLSTIGKLMISTEFLMVCAFLVSLFVFLGGNPLPLAMSALGWVTGIGIIMAVTPGSGWKDVLTIPGMLVFQMAYGFVLGFRSVFGSKSVVWKGRVFEK